MAVVVTQGSKLEVKVSGLWTKVAGVFDADGPQTSRGTIDVSDWDSTAAEKRDALKDHGTWSFQINWHPTDPALIYLRGRLDSGTPDDFRVTFADNSTATFQATVRGMPMKGPKNDVWRATLQLEVTGDITWS